MTRKQKILRSNLRALVRANALAAMTLSSMGFDELANGYSDEAIRINAIVLRMYEKPVKPNPRRRQEMYMRMEADARAHDYYGEEVVDLFERRLTR